MICFNKMKTEILADGVTLYCGDSRDIMLDIPAVDAVVTDVPYEISQESGGLRELDYGAWDSDGATDVALSVMRLCVSVPSVLAFCEYRQLSKIFEIFSGRSTRAVAWIKTNPTVMNGQHLFLPALELAYYGKLPGAWFGGNCIRSVWEGGAPSSRSHPTEKPLDLIKWAVVNTVEPGTTCLDPFMGSGTTGVASVALGRKFIGIEQDEKYFDIARRRIGDSLKQIDMFIPMSHPIKGDRVRPPSLFGEES